MKDLDWNGVPPGRRPETRRRIAILDEFIALTKPTEADRAEAMRRLGVGRASFYRLVAIWQEHRSPALLPGAHGSRTGAGRGRTLDPQVAIVIEEVITSVGAVEAPVKLEREVERRCLAIGLKPPSLAAIRRRRRSALLANVELIPPILNDRSVIVDSSALDLPALLAGRAVLPVVTAAFLQPEGWIAAYRVGAAPPHAAIEVSLLLELMSVDAVERAVVLHPQPSSAWRIMLEATRAAGLPPAAHVRHDYGVMFRRLTGDALGGLPLAVRSTRDPTAGQYGRLALQEEIEGLIAEAIGIHNEGRGASADLADVPHGSSVHFSVGHATSKVLEVLQWLNRMPEIIHSQS